jgi:ABC-2 type transport system permease protein
MAIVSTCFQGLSIGLAMHRDQGVLKRIIATPLPLRSLVAAKVLSSAFVALVEIALIVTFGATVYSLGWPDDPVVFIGASIIGALAFSAMGMALTAVIPTSESAPAIANAAYLPLVLLSNAFYDTSKASPIVQAIGDAMPLNHLVNPLRTSWVGTGELNLALDLGVLVAWGVACALFATSRMRWVPAGER